MNTNNISTSLLFSLLILTIFTIKLVINKERNLPNSGEINIILEEKVNESVADSYWSSIKDSSKFNHDNI